MSYYFPPLGGIGSIRILRFAENLMDYGWKTTVLAPRDGAYHRDPSLIFPEERVIRTRSIELSRVGKRLACAGGTDTEAASVHGARGLLRSVVNQYVYFPDAQIGWYLPAVLRTARSIHAGDYDAIFSSSFPVTAHLVARTLHRRLGAPWVAEFRDPWCAALTGTRSARRRAERLEQSLTQEASALVTVSPSWARLLGAAWQREVSVIPNGHDAIQPSASGLQTSSGFRLGYLGTYYPQSQNLDAVWSAATLVNRDTRTVDEIRVVGSYDGALASHVEACGAKDLLSFSGYLSYADASAEISRCAALVLAGPQDSAGVGRGWIPAKLFEYLSTNLPIIYVGHPDTDAADILRSLPGTHIVRTGDIPAAVEALRTVRSEVAERDVTHMSRHALAGRLAALLDDVSSSYRSTRRRCTQSA
ncbi:MAG: glycosyltransferase [Actinomycetota bacterium]|nr:glycosyltransferase [Actinomycetota bacterium]